VVSAARILVGDVRNRLQELSDGSVQCVVTSPPYWGLRDYGHEGQIGLEQTPDEYVAELVAVFREVRRVLADDGTLWLNLGDSYASGKQLVGIPWRVAFALQADGWWLRQDVIWAKPNPMPESVTDRCTKAHEYVFLLTKSAQYFYDAAAIAEEVAGEFLSSGAKNPRYGRQGGQMPSESRGEAYKRPSSVERSLSRSAFLAPNDGTRNKRSVWTITTKPYSGGHFAVMPMALVEPCILAGSERLDTVLDPFCGSGTVGVVALRNQRKFIGIELNAEYADLADRRIYEDGPLFNEVEIA
jgi:DNA modification methylase